jgi:WD40 repeat protein
MRFPQRLICLLAIALLLSTMAFARDAGKPLPDILSNMPDAMHSDPLPPYAVARIGTTRLRHAAEVSSLAFSPDGTRISSATIWFDTAVWDVRTGRSIAFRSSRQQKGLFRAVVSPDGSLFAGRLEGGELGVQRARDGKIIQRFAIRCEYWEGVDFSRDNRRLAAADRDGNTYIWDVTAGKVLHQFKTKPSGVWDDCCHAFSPDGSVFVQARRDDITFWNVASGKQIRRIDSKKENEWSAEAAISPDGAILAVRIAYGRVDLWDTKTGKLLRSTANHKNDVGPVFSPDGKSFATGGESGEIYLWNVETGELARTLEAPAEENSASLAFSPDGKTLASGGGDHAIHLWDLALGQKIDIAPSRIVGRPTVRFLSDGSTLLVHCHSDAHRLLWSIDERLSFWDFQGNLLREAKLALEGAHAFALSGDARTVAYGSGPHFNTFFRPDQNRYLKSSVRVCELASGKQLAMVEGVPCQIDELEFSPDNRFLFVNAFNAGPNDDDYGRIDALQVWMRKSPTSLKKIADLPTLHFLSGHCVSPDSRWVVVTGENGYRFHDCETGKLMQSYSKVPGSAVAVSPDGQVIVSRDAKDARGGKEVIVWNKASGKTICKLDCAPGQTDGAPLAVSPDGQVVVGCLNGEVITLWDLFKGKQIGQLQGHRGGVSSLGFSADGRYLVSASEDTTILVWDWSKKLAEILGKAKSGD